VLKPAGIQTQAPPNSKVWRYGSNVSQGSRGHERQHLIWACHIASTVPSLVRWFLPGMFAPHNGFSKHFEAARVAKNLLGFGRGDRRSARGNWRDTLWKVHGQARCRRWFDSEHPQGRPAVLHYRTLGIGPHGSWLEIEFRNPAAPISANPSPPRVDTPFWATPNTGSQIEFGPVLRRPAAASDRAARPATETSSIP